MSIKLELNREAPSPTPKDPEPLSGVIVDAKGRKLKVRELGILEESRLVRMLGEAASNAMYVTGYVMPAVMVEEIDGEQAAPPTTLREVDAAIQRLGRHGIAAVLAHVTALAERQEGQDQIKNSSRTPDSAAPAG
ncbi:MAG: hypothetical protein ACREUT_20310 [Steroidobacteraceae bacterium]